MSFVDFAGSGATPRSATQRGGPFDSQQPSNAAATSAVSSDDGRQQTERIQSSIFAISANVATIQRIIGNLGTPKDTHDMRERLHGITQTTQDLVKQTTTDLKELGLRANALPSDEARRLRKLEQSKLSKDFQLVLARFQSIQRIAAEKSREYVAKARAKTHQYDHLDDDHHGSGLVIGGSGTAVDAPLLAEESRRQQEILQLDREIEYNELVIQEREQSIVEIQHAIQEVNEIFRDLGSLVNDQQGMLDNIEANIESTAARAGDATIELQGADRYQRRARNRMCCLLLVFAIILAIVILVVALAH